MRTRWHGVAALAAVLLAVGAVPALGVEIVIVPPPALEAAPAPKGSDCGWLSSLWLRFLALPKCCPACVKRECVRPCGPGCLQNSGYYRTRWHYLPSESGLALDQDAGQIPGGQLPASPAELLPPADTENSKQPPAEKKGQNNNSNRKPESLPAPKANPAKNNTGMLSVPVYAVYPATHFPAEAAPAPASSYGTAPQRR